MSKTTSFLGDISLAFILVNMDSLEGQCRRLRDRLDIDQTLKLLPHPHVVCALGFFMLKLDPIKSSL